jgi:hypothetical protein
MPYGLFVPEVEAAWPNFADSRGTSDLTRAPIEERKAELTRLARHASAGLQLCEHIDLAGELVFAHACTSTQRRGEPMRRDDRTLPRRREAVKAGIERRVAGKA